MKKTLILFFLVFAACNPLGDNSTSDSSYLPGLTGGTTTTYPAPTVTSVSPVAGDLVGGQTITVTGTGFLNGVTFKVDGVACTTSTYISSTSGTCVTPAGAGIDRVSVTSENTDSQSATLTEAFDYIGNPKIWLKADAIESLNDGDPIATWPESSVNNNDFTQPTGARQPLWIESELSGMPVVRFSNSDMVSTNPIGISGAGTRSTFFLIKQAAAANRNFFGWGGFNTDLMYDLMIYTGKFMVHFYSNDSTSVGPVYTPTNWSLLTSVYNGANIRLYRDGANSGGPYAAALNTTDTTANIGNGTYNGGYFNYNGDIAEAIVLSIATTGAEQLSVECYLSRKYNLNLAVCP